MGSLSSKKSPAPHTHHPPLCTCIEMLQAEAWKWRRWKNWPQRQERGLCSKSAQWHQAEYKLKSLLSEFSAYLEPFYSLAPFIFSSVLKCSFLYLKLSILFYFSFRCLSRRDLSQMPLPYGAHLYVILKLHYPSLFFLLSPKFIFGRSWGQQGPEFPFLISI